MHLFDLHFVSLVGLALLFLVLALGIPTLFFKHREIGLEAYIKKKYLFDIASEFELFKLLNELFGERFYIFPQVNYSHLVEVRKDLSYGEQMRYRNKIDRKSADFVLCDKERVVPQLVIELDGSSHTILQRQERDVFINGLMKKIELRILHLHPERMERKYVESEIEKALLPSSSPN